MSLPVSRVLDVSAIVALFRGNEAISRLVDLAQGGQLNLHEAQALRATVVTCDPGAYAGHRIMLRVV
jgi:hypothetical protein